MIFLDSDIVSYYFSGNQQIRDKILETIKNQEKIAVAAINIYELLKGFRWRKNEKKERLFKKFLEKVFVFSLDDNAIDLAADIYADLRENGKTIGDADILIAAIVMNNNGKLVSNNTKHYKDIKGLKLVNWLEENPNIV
ncbi:MAG: PIN domain-containing protein [Defluviitaleaceae bacterium]|nr:PIN domain-containing protein [Defluviitaleaceae bacterium]